MNRDDRDRVEDVLQALYEAERTAHGESAGLTAVRVKSAREELERLDR